MSSSPVVPPLNTPPTVTRTVLSEELEQVLDFTSKENEKHREFFERLYKLTAGSLTVIFVAVGAIVAFFGWRTISDIRKQAETATNTAVQESRKQISDETTKQIADLRKQVSERVNAEFQTQAIRGTVQQVAAQQTRDTLMPVITREVKSQVVSGVHSEQQTVRTALLEEVHKSVAELQPTIDSKVDSAVRSSVDPAVQSRVQSQVEPRLRQLANSQELSSLVIGAETGDARSFDRLYALAISANTDQAAREVAVSAIREVIDKFGPALYVTRNFNDPKTQEQQIALLTDPDPWTRKASLDTLGQSYWRDHLDALFKILISDDSLLVRSSAFYYFRLITNYKATPLIAPQEQDWWAKHRSEFVK